MRLKEFIIFLIIFTICYFLFFYFYDVFTNKKALEKNEKDTKTLIDLDKYYIFSSFYGIDSHITGSIINLLYFELKQSLNNNLEELSLKYSISIEEVIVVIMFLEYSGVIMKRKIIGGNNCVSLNNNDETLILKYSLLFANKSDYETIVKEMGITTLKELNYMSEHYLIPGIIFKDSTLTYVGDINE